MRDSPWSRALVSGSPFIPKGGMTLSTRRSLQVSLVACAAVALGLALSGAIPPASASPGEPVPLPAVLPVTPPAAGE